MLYGGRGLEGIGLVEYPGLPASSGVTAGEPWYDWTAGSGLCCGEYADAFELGT